jgi:mono/diheme cytochrome c family protein
MPAWSQFLTPQQIGDVARYLVVFSSRFVDAWRAHRAPQIVAVPTVPSAVEEMTAAHPRRDVDPSLARAGEGLWNLHHCGWCHGDDGRGDGPTARRMTDDWHRPIRPANLRYKWLFRNGHRPEDVYRTIFCGLNGTPMGSYASAISNDSDRWAIVAFVLSLSPRERPVLHLGDFAKQRDERIGRDGLVLPAQP